MSEDEKPAIDSESFWAPKEPNMLRSILADGYPEDIGSWLQTAIKADWGRTLELAAAKGLVLAVRFNQDSCVFRATDLETFAETGLRGTHLVAPLPYADVDVVDIRLLPERIQLNLFSTRELMQQDGIDENRCRIPNEVTK